MNLLPFPSLSLVTVAVSIVAATTPATLDHRPASDAVRAASAAVLDCRLDRTAPDHTTRLLLTNVANVGDRPLPGGMRYAWATLGTPAPQGEVRALEEPLARGASVAVVPALPAHGSGCIAVQAG